MPPPQDGNEYLPFADLVKLGKVDDRTFQSVAMPFAPGGPVGQGRAYGGHVYMQAAWAACQTVAEVFCFMYVDGRFCFRCTSHQDVLCRHVMVRGRLSGQADAMLCQ